LGVIDVTHHGEGRHYPIDYIVHGNLAVIGHLNKLWEINSAAVQKFHICNQGIDGAYIVVTREF
jgi:hypothetical protein